LFPPQQHEQPVGPTISNEQSSDRAKVEAFLQRGIQQRKPIKQMREDLREFCAAAFWLPEEDITRVLNDYELHYTEFDHEEFSWPDPMPQGPLKGS
jgi:hypothetical protein